MKYKLYTILDKAAKEAGPVFCAVNDAVASRNYRQVLKQTDSPEDYEMFLLGVYDSETMVVEGRGVTSVEVMEVREVQ